MQQAYEKVCEEQCAGSSLEERIFTAMYSYLRRDLGLSEPVAQARARAEVSGELNRKRCDECETATGLLSGKVVLDLGAGLGGLSAEMARRGAIVLGMEPGSGWRAIAAERVGGNAVVLGACGENLPVASGSVDLIVSLQVLEHVQNPKRVIEEAYRVLKPGGCFFFAYENYLSFYEPHYRVRWFPLLPKRLGAAYLRRLGRDSKFLLEAVTYTTFPSVRRHLFRTGFECMRHAEFRRHLSCPTKKSPKWRTLKALAKVDERAAMSVLAAQDYLRRVYKTGIAENVCKPAQVRGAQSPAA